ncbi:transcription termination factor MTEF1, chloroplastic-like [Magnolia sinica]|uniref:transcription termination factor MTEF1, chloroplastic-like n=1 Tax=Magnolia sinica TaxID=86752 RepID=UPI0026580163|nr:transcription termination factor MTEF1, chloroplastic-like [Magnolia sinica]XP_058090377.1 transcription termination factor MTEF1, chloroplastic-like [Magnolia sinica]
MRARLFIFSFSHFSLAITRPSISFLSSFGSAANVSCSNSKPFIFNYLIENFGFSETVATATLNRLPNVKQPNKPDSVLHFLRQSGFSETHIRDAVRISPQILFANIEKTLEPKFKVFQELGLTGSDLGLFLSKNAKLLTASLDQKLIPGIKILKNILSNDDHVIRVLQRCKWILYKDPSSRLLPNISFLQSCGIVGSQLSMLLKYQPILFAMKEPKLQNLIIRVKEMGFSVDSRMFVYALYTVSCMMPDTLQRKFELFRSFGFSEEEFMSAFRKAPSLLRTSEKKLQLGIEFFVNTVGLDRSALVNNPTCLMHSLEKRVSPRHRVIEILRSKMLLKNPSIIYAMQISEADFLEKYILKFGEDAGELLAAYQGGGLDISKS